MPELTQDEWDKCPDCGAYVLGNTSSCHNCGKEWDIPPVTYSDDYEVPDYPASEPMGVCPCCEADFDAGQTCDCKIIGDGDEWDCTVHPYAA